MALPQNIVRNQFVSPPRAYGPTGPVGQELVATVSPTAQVVALELVVNPPPYNWNNERGAAQQKGVTGQYITIFADGCDLGIVFADSIEKVTGGAAPDLSKRGTLSGSGTYQGATGVCHRIPSGQSLRVNPCVGVDKYMGVVASATGAMRMYQSNPANMGG